MTGVWLRLKAPYAGANRIRFQGTLSAWQIQAPPLQVTISLQMVRICELPPFSRGQIPFQRKGI